MFWRRLCVLFWCFLAVKAGTRLLNENALGRFQCPPNTVLVVYDDELPYALYMACQQANICNNILNCASSDGTCPKNDGTGLSFLQHVREDSKFKSLQKGCCTYTRPQEHEATQCFKIEVTDKLNNGSIEIKYPSELQQFLNIPKEFVAKPNEPRNANPSGPPSPGEESPPSPLSESQVWNLVDKFFQSRTRNKRAVSEATSKVGVAEVYLHKLRKSPDQILIVNDLSRIKDGYTINACHIHCKDTTTTTTQKTTTVTQKRRRPTEKQHVEYEDEVPDEPKHDRPKPKQKPPKQPETPEEPPTAKEIQVDVGAPGVPGAPACFSADSTVETTDGSKRMDDLATGDMVLVTSSDRAFEPIELWYHRMSDRESEFVVIETETKSISLSPNHLLPFFDCDYMPAADKTMLEELVKTESKFASRARVGQCLIAKQTDGGLALEQINKVSRRVKRGIYSPVTAAGTLLVDGVYVSCFSTFENHDAFHTLHGFLMKMYSAARYLIGSAPRDVVDVPNSLQIIMHVAQLVLPESMF